MLIFFLNLLFPVSCGVCNRSLNLLSKDVVCHKCSEEIEKINSNGCRFCGKPVGYDGAVCNLCNENISNINKCYTACYYKDNIKSLIINFKYNKKRYLSKFLGELLFGLYEIYLRDKSFDFIVPVPLSPAKKKQRGFNQVEIISRYLSKKTCIKMKSDIIKRSRNTEPQFNLTRSERFKNMHLAFKTKKDLHGKNIILIDDVATTGATIQNSAKALREAGAEKIYALLLAHGK